MIPERGLRPPGSLQHHQFHATLHRPSETIANDARTHVQPIAHTDIGGGCTHVITDLGREEFGRGMMNLVEKNR